MTALVNKRKQFGTAIILAGGQSRRMGFDKQYLMSNGMNLIDYQIHVLQQLFDEIIVVANNPKQYVGQVKILEDHIQGLGPVGGIYTGLKACSSQYAYLIACDMPVINLEYIQYMQSMLAIGNYQACLSDHNGFIETFNSFISTEVVNCYDAQFLVGKRSVFDLLQKTNYYTVPCEKVKEFDADFRMFFNLNTPKDLWGYNNAGQV